MFNDSYKRNLYNYTHKLVQRMANDNDELQGPKTKPLRKTSAVPLRKETVRVTLKATPTSATGAPRPPAPAPPKPPSVATTPLETSPIDDAPKQETGFIQGKDAALPDETSAVPLRQETMRVTLKSDTSGAPMAPTPSVKAPTPTPAPASPAPSTPAPATPAATIPLGGGGGPAVPQPATPAATVPLQTTGVPAATVPLATQPLGNLGASQPLPKATVELQQTQQITAPLGTAAAPMTMPSLQQEWEEEISRGHGMTKILSIVALVVALAALGAQAWHSKAWLKEHYKEDWAKLTSPDTQEYESTFKKKKNAKEYITVNK